MSPEGQEELERFVAVMEMARATSCRAEGLDSLLLERSSRGCSGIVDRLGFPIHSPSFHARVVVKTMKHEVLFVGEEAPEGEFTASGNPCLALGFRVRRSPHRASQKEPTPIGAEKGGQDGIGITSSARGIQAQFSQEARRRGRPDLDRADDHGGVAPASQAACRGSAAPAQAPLQQRR